MPNMSYCRFHNTLNDLRDCIGALEDKNISSESERRSAKNLLVEILDFCADEGIIEEYDSNRIEEFIDKCVEQEEE